MKHRAIMILIVVAISLLTYACGPTEREIRATVEAELAQEKAQNATQTAIAGEQATLTAEKTAIAIAQTALAASPTPALVATTPAPAPTEPTGAALIVSCPFYVYDDWGSALNHYVPEGWMGDISDINLDDNYQLDPVRPNVIRIVYTPSGSNQWAGIYGWDPPGGDWAKVDGGFDLSCATKLAFWARGDTGGEKAEFKVGGLSGTYKDSLQPALPTGPIALTNTWVQYTLNLTGKDLSHTIGGLVWVTNKPSNPNGATIYLDEIKFEK